MLKKRQDELKSTEAGSDSITTTSFFKLSKKDDIQNLKDLKDSKLPQIEVDELKANKRSRTPRNRRCRLRQLVLEEYFDMSADDSDCADEEDEEEDGGDEDDD